MPSRSIHSWTLASLIGSYFDLALAYFLLIGSTLTFFLPCPYRIQTLLFSWIRTRIESVQRSILTRFPFDLILKGSEPDRNGDRVLGRNQVGLVMGKRIRRRRVSGLRKGKWVSGLNGAGGDFGGEKSKSQHIIIEDDVSRVGEALLATKYCSVEDTSSATRHVNASIWDTELIIKNLERELEEAQATHAVLYLELEKERSAAATAADEAMAMILRLQSEKAALEMESQQYQRMIEEKSAYDEEEMEILKEIIVRREREKYVLENEIAMYQQKQLSGEITIDKKPDSFFDSTDDPTLMLETICEPIGEKEKVNNKKKWIDDDSGIHYPELQGTGDKCNINIHEKGLALVGIYPSGHCQSCNLDLSQELGFCKELSCLSGEKNEGREAKIERKNADDELNGENQDEDQRGSNSSWFETESSTIDVHVIDDKHNLDIEEGGLASNISEVGCASELSRKGGVTDKLPSTNNADLSTKTLVTCQVGVEQDIQEICWDTNKSGKLIDVLGGNASHFDLSGNSMFAVARERFKLETEVEFLRKTLKSIHQGRENLSFSMEYRERENVQLELLEEIACHFQEIKNITEPGKSIRQTSLPSLSSTVTSKKRWHCRSVSCGF